MIHNEQSAETSTFVIIQLIILFDMDVCGISMHTQAPLKHRC